MIDLSVPLRRIQSDHVAEKLHGFGAVDEVLQAALAFLLKRQKQGKKNSARQKRVTGRAENMALQRANPSGQDSSGAPAWPS